MLHSYCIALQILHGIALHSSDCRNVQHSTLCSLPVSGCPALLSGTPQSPGLAGRRLHQSLPRAVRFNYLTFSSVACLPPPAWSAIRVDPRVSVARIPEGAAVLTSKHHPYPPLGCFSLFPHRFERLAGPSDLCQIREGAFADQLTASSPALWCPETR